MQEPPVSSLIVEPREGDKLVGDKLQVKGWAYRCTSSLRPQTLDA
jgi:hypothetical protein